MGVVGRKPKWGQTDIQRTQWAFNQPKGPRSDTTHPCSLENQNVNADLSKTKEREMGQRKLLEQTVKCLTENKTKDSFPNESLPRLLFLHPISVLSLWA